MSPASLVQAIRSSTRTFADALADANLLLDANDSVATRIGRGRTLVAWEGYAPSRDWDHATIEVYVSALDARQFSLLLVDGAIFQLCHTVRQQRIEAYSLAYCPCPVSIARDELRELVEEGFGLTEIVNDKLHSSGTGLLCIAGRASREGLSGQCELRLKSALRFDYDCEAERPDHPASHLHVFEQACRVPVYAPISIGLFATFVLQHFYPNEWNGSSALRALPISFHEATISSAFRQGLFLAAERPARPSSRSRRVRA